MVLKGAAGAALALPALSSWRGDSGWGVLNLPVAVAADGRPRRVIFWVGGLGTIHEKWTPKNTSADGKSWELNEIMQPLAAYKQKMTVLTGINMASLSLQGQGFEFSHYGGGAHALTSNTFTEISPFGPQSRYAKPRSASIDQLIAERVGVTSRFASLYVGDVIGERALAVIRADGSEVGRQSQPSWIYDSVFKDFEGGAAEREARRKSRLAGVSSVLPSYKHLRARLSASDQRVLDAHFDSLSDLEKRLARTDACTPPTRPGDFWDPNEGESHALGDRGEGPYAAISETVARALACQLTSVVTYGMWGALASPYDKRITPNFDAYKDNLGAGDRGGGADMHSLSHESRLDSAEAFKMARGRMFLDVLTWRMKKLADFVKVLAESDDIDGNKMIDNTCIVHVSEIMVGDHQTLPDKDGKPAAGMPVMLIGGLGDRLKTGLHLDLSQGDTYGTRLGKYSHGELYLTIARAMGISAAKLPIVGHADVCKRTIDEILAFDPTTL